jgi:DNA-binding MarR family transcriptional regulator
MMAKKPAELAKAIRTPLTVDDGIDFPMIELFFFAYRDFTSDPDQLLAAYGFGRAHHRVVHFVNRIPGLTVAELLDVLKITKQSLARVLKQLIDTGYVVQIQGLRDRRQRELYPTDKGRDLALALAAPQSVETFLRSMVDPDLRAQIEQLPGGAGNVQDRAIAEPEATR